MSENSNSASGNSGTLLTPGLKESGAENVGPVAEGHKVEGQLSKTPEPSSEANHDLEKHSSEASAHQPETETSSQLQSDPALTHGSEQAQETQVTSPDTNDGRAQLNAAHVNEDPSSVTATAEDVSSWTPDHEEREALTGHSASPVSPVTDVDSFSDSHTHIDPTSGSSPLPASVCQERESLRKTTEESKGVLETNRKDGDGLRKRKISHLGSLDKTEAEDDEEGEEEDFQLPQREEETVFSLNKCLLASVILLGLGTIFFSGVLMDLDDEADMDVKDLKNPTNQEWLNPEVSRDTPVDLQPPDILSKQAKEDKQILILQAQLQQHQGELKAAQLQVEDGEKERVRREELEKEYQRIKAELDRLPALQKELERENERMKEENVRAKKELEALPSLQSELEHLRAKVSQLTQSTESAKPVHPVAASRAPPAGDKRDALPIDRQDMKYRKTWDKKSEEKEQSKGDKERKKKKSGKNEDDKERSKREQTKEQKDWKKDKSHQEEGKAGKRKEWMKDKKRGDGKIGKESEDKRKFKEWEEKKEWKEDKKGKKDKHVGQDERRGDKKDWKDTGKKKGKEEKEWKGERKEDKDRKNDKQSGGSDHKEWKEKKKGEKEWKKEKSEGKHNDKTEKKWKGEREFPKEDGGKDKEKHWREKERESKDEVWKREGVKEKKNKAFYHQNEGKKSPSEKEKPDETTSHHHSEHENYWSKQRERIQHFNGQRDTCSGVADCARVEGLAPVGLRDFQTLLQSYMNKLPDPQDQTSREEELHKLVKEFFTDGVFAHDQIPFSEFVDDVGDILEDLAEGEESDSEGEENDEDDDDEMEEFEREAMEKFALPEELRKGEQKKESRRVKG
ncbi:pre-B-cell leukemia homeobox interacting protein 1b isoform X1 [Pimephales promelas]|uniref:pre-B-cell leukemia homeobox interacting protein 1b isoform X1 n=1 Tax=Pimephales promelas TaxID=90988 RepID=UPI001955D389|nr:pre-B-cell leukemia homeobox interacting protein 1b isoform X1 [Pimephales promelas]